MGLIPKWHGVVELPPLPERRLNVGGNWIIQQPFRGAVSRASISDSQYPGHDQIELRDLAPPFDIVLLRQRGARRINIDLPVVTAQAFPDSSDPSPVAVTWDSHGMLEQWADTPAKVRKAWVNKFDFRIEDADEGIEGLRVPQIGALHAISAHFAVGRQFDAATVVLPTGTGKTETMLATQVYRRLERSLVLVPSDALRRQIAKKFISLGVLPKAGVVPADTAGPRVAVITAGVRSADDARTIVDNANVIVALPNSLQASDPGAVAVLADGCSDLIVDEAHHIRDHHRRISA
ncbi:DEAD/DEAH box helicase family protein [Sphingobium sp. SCG-1]|uniref:DEAD/DEAH box helicase family protein n=1 Tax=Sphingobium sp. SCG-1 TaxID=2072936 RepID=UPI001CB9D6D4|nr:DEAD/DEAH box helicase family protein [Sphingobium sp. SCG-1]